MERPANEMVECARTMRAPAEKQDSRQMRAMFGAIAPRYDFITRIFSYGMDGKWKRECVEDCALADNAVVLDLAAGTGDFSKLVMARLPQARTVAVDLTEPMLRVARASGIREAVCGDAGALPFADASFDCVFVGYGLRNFQNLGVALREIERVTRPGGRMVSLDFFLPRNVVFRRCYLTYLFLQGAFWGLLLHGRARTYTYIPDSLKSFLSIDIFSAMLEQTGYERVKARSFILGGIGLHSAIKASSQAKIRAAV
ncbi:MAG TPA: ubiquinone/menaquinone biosynthesis methyltransferase [Candidatus Acidoferrales bacterium]